MSKILFVVEGQKAEPAYLKNIEQVFFSRTTKNEIEWLIIPYKTLIYTLAKEIQADPDLQLIELLKEKHPALVHIDTSMISEIYLLFDYDGHDSKNSISDKVAKLELMFEIFHDETENGKLYISYPMIEAVKDLVHEDAINRTQFQSQWQTALSQLTPHLLQQAEMPHYFVPSYEDVSYKQLLNASKYQDIRSLDISKWSQIIQCHHWKLGCLSNDETLTLEQAKQITPASIHHYQHNLFIEPFSQVAVLASLPHFIIEYFKIDILKTIIQYD